MKAEDALQLSESKIPGIYDKEYNSIIENIKQASERGKTHTFIGYDMPSVRVIDRLRNDGYKFYSTGADFIFPIAIHSISWEKDNPQKHSFLKRLFNT